MKTIYIKYFIALFFTGIIHFISAQNVEFTKYNFPNNTKELGNALDEIKEGDKFYEDGPGYYIFAIDHYLNANNFNPNNAMLNYKIGRCYIHYSDRKEALKFLEKAYSLNPKISLDLKYNDIHFLLAKAYHMTYDFDKAITHYNEHESSLEPEQLILQKKQIDKYIRECEIAKKLVAKPERVFVDNLGSLVNSAFPDYSPVVIPEETMIMFTSARDNTTGGERAKDSYYFEDIYVTYFKDGAWSVADNTFRINTDNHDATAGISSDGQILYVYKSSAGNKIFECTVNNGIYTDPEKLPGVINDGLITSSASLSFDRSTLFYTSNRDGGYGGKDIYYTKKDSKDRWTDAVNIGAAINTPFDEESVFISTDGKTLYFSSNGNNSMGGHDIFYSTFENGKWKEPINMGYPINTPDDDVFFTLAASGQRGYYSSKKADGYGDQDLYIITFLGSAKPMINNGDNEFFAYKSNENYPLILEPRVEQNTILTGTITDALSMEPLQATIEIVDNEKNELIGSFESNEMSGGYLLSLRSGINYGISVSKQDYMFHSENFDIPADAVAKKVRKDIQLKKIAVGTKIVLNNIFFDFNKATIRPESTPELERLYNFLIEVPTLKIEISGHTDNVGSATYNQKLSEDRAKSVVDHLINKGISLDRLTFAGYGFTQPVATNETEEGRQLNRRTEFKILSK